MVLRSLSALAAALALGGCALSEDDTSVGRAQSAIVLGWEASWAPSVGALVDDEGNVYCTGTLVSSRGVLTAAHCARSGATQARFGTLSVRIADWASHPGFDKTTLDADIAVAVLETPPPPEVWRALLSRDPLEPSFVGAEIAILGYGVDGPGGTAARRGGLARVTRLDPTTFRSELAPSQPCAGDSGGPALVLSEEQTIVLGVISAGDPSCAAHATYMRLDRFLAPFVDPTLAAIADGARRGGERCYHASNCEAGECFRPVAKDALPYCSPSCTSDAECATSMTCSLRAGDDGHGRCRYPTPPGTLGASCTEDSDCGTRHCARTVGGGRCVKSCIPDFVACDAGFACEADGGRFACIASASAPALVSAPATDASPRPADGCSSTAGSSHVSSWILIALGALGARRIRGRAS